MRFLLATTVLFLALGCAQVEPVMTPDPEGFKPAWGEFSTAWDELEVAIRSTPRWQMKPESRLRVRGLADLTIDRAERLTAWSESELMSVAAINLIKTEVLLVSEQESISLPVEGANVIDPVGDQSRSFIAESSYHRIESRLHLLEAYIAGPARLSWLDQQVLKRDRAALREIDSLDWEDSQTWRRIRVSESQFEELKERAAALSSALDA